MRARCRWLWTALLVLFLFGCASAKPEERAQLAFEASVNVGTDGEFHVSLGVRNAGDKAFPGDKDFNARMELRPQDGELRASAEVTSLDRVAPGDTAWPTFWRGRLEPGVYQLTWGAPGYSSTTVDFTIVDREGRLYLEEGVVQVPTEDRADRPEESVSITSVEVSEGQVVISGRSTPSAGGSHGTWGCILTELLADGQAQAWWPTETCAARRAVQDGTWEMVVPLGQGEAPAQLDVNVMYEVRAWPQDDPQAKAVFPFDLQGPPAPMPPREIAYAQIQVAEAGLTVEVPGGWRRLEPKWVWTPDETSDLRLGVNWMDLQPPTEPEAALLPDRAQVVQSDPLDLGWASGRKVTLEVYAPAAQGGDAQAAVQRVETHTLIVVQGEATRRAFDLYAVAPNAEQLAALEPTLQHMLDTAALSQESQRGTAASPMTAGTDWQTFRDEEYGFRLQYPQDWEWKELETEGPGMPDDWPVVRIVQFYPQAWAEELNKGGPPDPTAKPVVAPLSLEICVGPIEQFRRVYPEPTRSEVREVNGVQVLVEEEGMGDPITVLRYVFQDPQNDEVRVALIDYISGFPERVEENEATAELVPLIVGTSGFE